MAVQLQLQREHGYVLFLVVLSVFVNFWACVLVDQARKQYNIPPPQMYAEQSHPNADAYNCVQRAHQNMLENLPIFYVLLFTSAVFRPRMASIAGLVRVLGFIVYVQGYSTGDPQKRLYAEFGHIATLVQLGLTIEAGIKILGIKGVSKKEKTDKAN